MSCGIDFICFDLASPHGFNTSSYTCLPALYAPLFLTPCRVLPIATIAALMQNDTEQTTSLCKACFMCVHADSARLVWHGVKRTRGCEAESICGASTLIATGGCGGAVEVVGERSVGGVGACDYSAALMVLPRLCLSEAN